MPEAICTHLINIYNPCSIILHGSRSWSKSRPHSDWDVFAIVEKMPPQRIVRLEILGENVEVEFVLHPIADYISAFGPKLRQCTILYDKEGIGKNIILNTKALYAAGFNPDDVWMTNHSLWYAGRLGGVFDSLGDNVIFSYYMSDIRKRIPNYWYNIKCNEYSKPIYIALVEMKNTDPDMYEKYLSLFRTGNHNIKYQLAKQIYEELFWDFRT